MEQTVRGFFEGLAPRLNAEPGALAGLSCVYQFNVGAERFRVAVRDGRAEVAAGEAGEADCTVTMEETTLLDLLAGRTNPQTAFLTGKIRVAGDMGLALKLGSLIRT